MLDKTSTCESKIQKSDKRIVFSEPTLRLILFDFPFLFLLLADTEKLANHSMIKAQIFLQPWRIQIFPISKLKNMNHAPFDTV